MASPETIGFVGDTHGGSFEGLWPVAWLPGNRNSGPKYLMGCFNEMVKDWPKLDLLFLMGDMVDGKQPKSQGSRLFTTEMSEQVEGIIEVLRPLVRKSKKVFRVHGTPYHETHDSPLKLLDKEFEVEECDQVIDLELPGGILNVAHHPIGGATLYSGTQVDREGLWALLAATMEQAPQARWIVRAHRHHFLCQESSHMTVVANPCWQLQTKHAAKQNYWRYQPMIGSTLMLRDKTHRGGYRFVPTLYKLPKRRVIKL